jgi:hypothetical protein
VEVWKQSEEKKVSRKKGGCSMGTSSF